MLEENSHKLNTNLTYIYQCKLINNGNIKISVMTGLNNNMDLFLSKPFIGYVSMIITNNSDTHST